MQRVGVTSFKQLSQLAGVSEKQLRRLRRGQILEMRVGSLQKLAEVLQVPIGQLIAQFSGAIATNDDSQALREECKRLQQQLANQRETLEQEFQQASLQVLESWLLQWSAAKAAVQRNPQLPANRLLPLVKPVEELLQRWGVEEFVPVGEETLYDPQWHQLLEGTAKPGERVVVRYAGYRQGAKLMYRAKVSPVQA